MIIYFSPSIFNSVTD